MKEKATVELEPEPAVSVPLASSISTPWFAEFGESEPLRSSTVPVGAVFPLTPATVASTPSRAVVLGEVLVDVTLVVEVSRVEGDATVIEVEPLAEL